MTQIREISEALDRSLKSDQLENVTIDFVEALTDSMLQDGFVKEIPIIGTIVGLTEVRA